MTIVFLFSEPPVFLSGLPPLFYLSLVRYMYYLSVRPSVSFLSHLLTPSPRSRSVSLLHPHSTAGERCQSAARVIGFRQRRFGNRRERNVRALIEYATDGGKPFASRNNDHAGRVTVESSCTRPVAATSRAYTVISLCIPRARG
jgi:hypothetical protein